MDSKAASRLKILADKTLQTVFERNRAKDRNLDHSRLDDTIHKNLVQLREGIRKLEADLNAAEQSGASGTQEQEDALVKLQLQTDKLEALMADYQEDTAREQLFSNMPRTQRDRIIRLQNEEVDPETLENGQLMQLQQRVMEDQDSNLDRLGEVIGRQRELGLLIGDELETHVQLLDETSLHVDRSQARLDAARKRLDKVNRTVKEHKSLCCIFVLIMVLVILISVLR